MPNDVFISYASQDKPVAEAVCASLEAQRIRCWIAPRDGLPGLPYGEAIAEAIRDSHIVLLVFSSHSNDSNQVMREVEGAVSHDIPILPFRIENIQPSKGLNHFIKAIHWLDALTPPLEKHLPSLGETVGKLLSRVSPTPPDRNQKAPESESLPVTPLPALRVALLYKRQAQPDEQLLKWLEGELGDRGHRVFVDRHMAIGVEWAKELERQVRESDALVLLLSAASVQSEMLTYEIQMAHDESQKRRGKPQMLPVRINFEGKLPPDIAGILDRLQYSLWKGPQDNQRLLAELLQAMHHPPAIAKAPPPGGVVPLDSEFYVVRPIDQEFKDAIARRDSVVLIRGARQMGKTSLLARGLEQARAAKTRVVMTDFQKLNAPDLESVESLFRTLGDWLADELDLEVVPGDGWVSRRGPSVNFERYIRREVLDKISTPLVWAMDEVDRLFPCRFASEVFGLFRSWHNARGLDPTSPWSRLTLAISYATEAHLFMTDMNQSPFNVGTLLVVEDFTPDQVEDLNRRYRSPLHNEEELKRYYRLLGGHPYLCNRGLYEMVHRQLALAAFEAQADRDEGVFGDHLRRILILLAKNPELCEAVRGVLCGRPCPTPESFYHLRSAGVLAGDSARDARLRCQLYGNYLERHLL